MGVCACSRSPSAASPPRAQHSLTGVRRRSRSRAVSATARSKRWRSRLRPPHPWARRAPRAARTSRRRSAMLLDIVGTISLPALALVLVAAIAPAGANGPVSRSRLALGIAAWFGVSLALGLLGAFASPVLPVGVAVGLAVFLPVIAGFGLVTRTQGLGVPMTTLVAVNAGRVIGSAFLMLHAAGRLPATFSHSAGWGDITTGVLAIPVMLAVRNRIAGWKW